jgi:N-acetylglucosamine kinase-like BadF-type ATPase
VTNAAAGRPLYGIDAGGSRTSVRAWNGDHWSGPPLNPSSVGQAESDRRLAELFTQLRTHARLGLGAGGLAVWLASAAIDRVSAGQETGRLAAAADAAGLRADLLVSNDVTPLLLGWPAEAGHVIAVCGTGSQLLATDGRSAPVRIGGCEYLGSDEGSAFDLGLRGLRAAVRGLDGRGPVTTLSDSLAAQAGVPVAELARALAQLPFPKPAVAALAPVVLRAWLDGDAAAAALVGDAVGELVLGMRAARDAAAIPPGWRLSVIGGVMTGCPELFTWLATEAAGLGAEPAQLISDPAAAVLAGLTQLAGTGFTRPLDPRVDSDVWILELAEAYPERVG